MGINAFKKLKHVKNMDRTTIYLTPDVFHFTINMVSQKIFKRHIQSCAQSVCKLSISEKDWSKFVF